MDRADCVSGVELMEEVRKQADDRLDPGGGTINICFSTTDALLSKAIRWFTGSTVSHSFITFRDRTLNRIMVMQASGHGYQIIPWARWETHNILVSRFQVPEKVTEKCQLFALRALARHIGDGYDARGLFGFIPILGVRIWNSIRGRWRTRRQGRAGGDLAESWRPRFHNLLDNPDKLFCSEAVAEYLGLAEPAWKDNYFERPQDWSPENLLGFAQRNLIEIKGEDKQVTMEHQLELSPAFWDRYEKRFQKLQRPEHVARQQAAQR